MARVLNFLLVPLYTRIFTDTAEYGIVNELYAYVAFFIVILTYGMETAFFRFASKKKDNQLVFSTALVSLLASSILFAVIVVIFYPAVGGLLGYTDRNYFILLLGMVLAVDAVTAIPFARLRLGNQSLKFALIKLFNISVNILFNLIFLVLLPWLYENGYDNFVVRIMYDPGIRVGYVFISNLIASIFTLLFFVKEIYRTQFRFSAGLLKSMLKYSFPLLIAGLAGIVNEVIDRIMLRYRLPDNLDALEQIGIYGANVKIAVIMLLFIQMFRYASEPFFFSQERNNQSRNLYAKVLSYFTIFGVFIFLTVTLYIDLFEHIIGPEYREGIKIVPVVLFGNLLLGIYYNLSIWYKLKELTIYGALFAILGASVTFCVNYFFIPYYGYIASAWGHFFAYLVMVIASYLIGRRYYSVPYKVKTVVSYLIIGAGIYLLSTLIETDDILKGFIQSSLFMIIFTAIVLYNEREIVVKFFRRHFNRK